MGESVERLSRPANKPEWVQDATYYIPPTSDAKVEIPEEWDVTSEDLQKALRPNRVQVLSGKVVGRLRP